MRQPLGITCPRGGSSHDLINRVTTMTQLVITEFISDLGLTFFLLVVLLSAVQRPGIIGFAFNVLSNLCDALISGVLLVVRSFIRL